MKRPPLAIPRYAVNVRCLAANEGFALWAWETIPPAPPSLCLTWIDETGRLCEGMSLHGAALRAVMQYLHTERERLQQLSEA